MNWSLLGSTSISRVWTAFPKSAEEAPFYRLVPSPSLNLSRVGRGWIYHRFRLFNPANFVSWGVSPASRFWLEKEPQIIEARGLLSPLRSLEAFFSPYGRRADSAPIRFKLEAWTEPLPPVLSVLSPTKGAVHEQYTVPPNKGEEPALATGYDPSVHSGGLLVNQSTNRVWAYLAKSPPSKTVVVEDGILLNQNWGQFSIPEGCSERVYLATSSTNPLSVFALYYSR